MRDDRREFHSRETKKRQILYHSVSRVSLNRSTVQNARRVAAASAIGTTIEWYDFFIYGTAAATVFGPRFFPQISPVAGTLASFATFGVGFVARPIGGVVMGHFGDRIGRKSMLVWSLMLMGLSTLAIGLLPDYARIGVWAPALLIVCRLVQGFALGGEWGGAVLMSVEHAPAAHRGFYGSVVALGLPAGIVLSNGVFLATSLFADAQEFQAWGWRVPFVASAVLVGIGLFIRAGLTESPEFDDLRRRGEMRRLPMLDVVGSNARTVLLAAGSYTGISALGYIVLVYYVSYATRVLKLPLPTVLMLLLLAATLFAVSVVTFARWSDRIGRRRIMLWGNAALVVWSAAFFPLLDTRSLPAIAAALCGILVLQGAYIGTQPAVFAELFAPAVRYSGASVSNTLGTILGGAPAPFIAASLYDATMSSTAIGLYITALAAVSWLSVLGLRETHETTLQAPQARN
jgi:metabolite-proton symporter